MAHRKQRETLADLEAVQMQRDRLQEEKEKILETQANLVAHIADLEEANTDFQGKIEALIASLTDAQAKVREQQPRKRKQPPLEPAQDPSLGTPTEPVIPTVSAL